MTATLDLSDEPDDEAAERIADALDDAATGESVDVVADRNIELALLGCQIDRGVALERDYDSTGPDRWALTVTRTDDLADEEHPAFDARPLPPQQRHSVLTDAFDELDPGEGFVLVNDHDPKPLYHELQSTRGDVVGWTYREEGGSRWAVAIEKTGAAEADAEDVVTRFDVREIPKRERHPTIHHRFGMIPEGGTLELIAPHEPRPLQREFSQRYGDAFAWDVVESEPGRCRVRITKAQDGTGNGDASADPAEIDAAGAAGEHACDHGAHGGSAEADDEAETSPDAENLEVVEEFDVRNRPPAERHERIYEAYADLDAGEAFVFVNDHDPKPLYHQFEAEAGPEFRWAYRSREPGAFRVAIGKADVDSGQGQAEDAAEPDAPF